MPKRHIMRIELTQGARKQHDQVPEKYGMTHVAISSRMLEWFSKQDAMTQKAIMMAEPGANSRELAKEILKKMAAG
jgi:hypothetical protein